jgi:tetratricopeptide (TPR) repeat protein
MSSFFRIPLLYLLTAIVAFATTAEPSSAFMKGIDSYQNSKYDDAKDQFTAAVESNETAAARHNLGLAHFQLGSKAEAIWQLERAQLLAPFNADYRYKLEAARQDLGLFASAPKWYVVASQVFPVATWFIIASASFWILLALFILTRISQYRVTLAIKTLRILSILTLLLALPSIWVNLRLLESGTVVSDKPVSLHAAPASAAPDSGTARPGERARILDQHNNFYEIETEGKATGWISKDAFRPLVD